MYSGMMIFVIIVSIIFCILSAFKIIFLIKEPKEYNKLKNNGDEFILQLIDKYSGIPIELFALNVSNMDFDGLIRAFLIDIQRKGVLTIKKNMFTIKLKSLNKYEFDILKYLFGFKCGNNDTYIASLDNIEKSINNCSDKNKENIISKMINWDEEIKYKVSTKDLWCFLRYFNDNNNHKKIDEIHANYLKTNTFNKLEVYGSIYTEVPI